LKIYYDGDKADEISAKLFDHFNSHSGHRTTVHLSDTVHCEMKCYNRLTGMIEARDKRSAAFMLFGEVGQELLQRVYPEEECEFSIEGELPLHIDIFENQEYPLEIKWSAQKIFRGEDIPNAWLQQLLGYMALTNKVVGWMVIVNLFTRELTTFKMISSLEELELQRHKIHDSVDRIDDAAKTKNPSKLVLVLDECPYCGFRPTRAGKKIGNEGCISYVPRSRKDSNLLPVEGELTEGLPPGT